MPSPSARHTRRSITRGASAQVAPSGFAGGSTIDFGFAGTNIVNAISSPSGDQASPPGASVTSLDWGFDAPLRLLRPDLDLDEPVWRMFGAPGATHVLHGEPGDVVLVWAPGFEVFPFGAQLAAALRSLPPGTVEIAEHTDRLGAPAFVSIRFARRHELVYRGGFEVRLR